MNRTFTRMYFDKFNRVKTNEEEVAEQYLSKTFVKDNIVLPVDRFDTLDFVYEPDMLIIRIKQQSNVLVEVTHVMDKLQQFKFKNGYSGMLIT